MEWSRPIDTWSKPSLTERTRLTSSLIAQGTEASIGARKGEGLTLRSIQSRAAPELCSAITELELASGEASNEADGVSRIHHYHFTDWPDHGVPSENGVEALYGLILEVDRQRKALGNCEVWVHW